MGLYRPYRALLFADLHNLGLTPQAILCRPVRAPEKCPQNALCKRCPGNEHTRRFPFSGSRSQNGRYTLAENPKSEVPNINTDSVSGFRN